MSKQPVDHKAPPALPQHQADIQYWSKADPCSKANPKTDQMTILNEVDQRFRQWQLRADTDRRFHKSSFGKSGLNQKA